MLPRDNPESWRQIHEFVEEFPDDSFWLAWKPIAREVIFGLEMAGMKDLFRIGQSMHHIVLSTFDHHNLGTAPRVTIEIRPKEEDEVRIAYSNANIYFNDPLTEVSVSRVDAVPTILCYLRRLWGDTKDEKDVPKQLKEGGEPGATDNPGDAQ